jgi:hypothetical protein
MHVAASKSSHVEQTHVLPAYYDLQWYCGSLPLYQATSSSNAKAKASYCCVPYCRQVRYGRGGRRDSGGRLSDGHGVAASAFTGGGGTKAMSEPKRLNRHGTIQNLRKATISTVSNLALLFFTQKQVK